MKKTLCVNVSVIVERVCQGEERGECPERPPGGGQGAQGEGREAAEVYCQVVKGD